MPPRLCNTFDENNHSYIPDVIIRKHFSLVLSNCIIVGDDEDIMMMMTEYSTSTDSFGWTSCMRDDSMDKNCKWIY